MLALIGTHRDELEDLCRKYRVKRLELFGSAARGMFDPDRSDLDFLVEFLPDSPMGAFRQYIDFLLDLRALFGCHVDLVETSAMDNPYFVQSATKHRKLLYAA